jgi:hypothetical protein
MPGHRRLSERAGRPAGAPVGGPSSDRSRARGRPVDRDHRPPGQRAGARGSRPGGDSRVRRSPHRRGRVRPGAGRGHRPPSRPRPAGHRPPGRELLAAAGGHHLEVDRAGTAGRPGAGRRRGRAGPGGRCPGGSAVGRARRSAVPMAADRPPGGGDSGRDRGQRLCRRGPGPAGRPAHLDRPRRRRGLAGCAAGGRGEFDAAQPGRAGGTPLPGRPGDPDLTLSSRRWARARRISGTPTRLGRVQ